MKMLLVKKIEDIPKNYTGWVKILKNKKKWAKIKLLHGVIHNHKNPAHIDNSGLKAWYKQGKLHRENDGPAIKEHDGTKHWYINGERHRENGPAVEYPNGTKKWYLNGRHHREDGPAVVFAKNFYEFWFENQKLNNSLIEELVDLDYPIETAIKLAYIVARNKK